MIKICSYLLLAFTISGCASSDKSIHRSRHEYILGPVPKETSLADIKDDLSRWADVENVGIVNAQLITPAYIYLNAVKQKERMKMNQAEVMKKIKREIDHLVRYESCFALSVKASNPINIEFNYWQAHIAYGDNLILPVKIKDMTNQLKANVFVPQESVNEYSGFATLCSVDKLNLQKSFTLVLKPNFGKRLPNIRLTWN